MSKLYAQRDADSAIVPACIPFAISFIGGIEMGAYSEMDLDMQFGSDNPFTSDGEVSTPIQAASQNQQASGSAASMRPQPPQADDAAKKKAADEDEKRRAHEESEAKRKAEWEARQQAKKAAEQEQLDKLAAMSDDEVMMASTQRIGADTERLTRRNMKECISEHIQTLCLEDPAFARKAMHPRKTMIHCIWYINRKAKEFADQEMKDNGFKPENGIYGCDVPDDLCYQWAEDYFNDPNAEEDKEKDEKFVSKPYPGSSSKAASKNKAKTDHPKKSETKTAPKQSDDLGQMTLGDIGLLGGMAG